MVFNRLIIVAIALTFALQGAGVSGGMQQAAVDNSELDASIEAWWSGWASRVEIDGYAGTFVAPAGPVRVVPFGEVNQDVLRKYVPFTSDDFKLLKSSDFDGLFIFASPETTGSKDPR